MVTSRCSDQTLWNLLSIPAQTQSESPSSLAWITAMASDWSLCFCLCPTCQGSSHLPGSYLPPFLTCQLWAGGLDPSVSLPLPCAISLAPIPTILNFQMVMSSEKRQRQPFCSCLLSFPSALCHYSPSIFVPTLSSPEQRKTRPKSSPLTNTLDPRACQEPKGIGLGALRNWDISFVLGPYIPRVL